MEDGDTIPGIAESLDSDQLSPSGFTHELMIGTCRSCDEIFYVVNAMFMKGEFDDLLNYLTRNIEDSGPERNFLCRSDSSRCEWLLQEYQTKKGLLHEHTFGPWPLKNTEGVITQVGVTYVGQPKAYSWIHGRDLLVSVWDDLRFLLKSSQSEE